MFKTNYKLIENISKEFNIENDKINNVINDLFEKITLSIMKGRKFYMDRIGVISSDENKKIIFSNKDENFDESLESLSSLNKDIKNIFLEKSIYKSIFKNIKDIAKEEKVYIENFGTFNNSDISFEADNFLINKIRDINMPEKSKDILDELNNAIINKRKEINNIENNDITEKPTDNDRNTTEDIKNMSKTEDKTNYNLEMREYSEEELLDLNNFDKEDLEDSPVNSKSVQKELLGTNKETINPKQRKDNKITEQPVRKNSLLGGIFKVVCIIIFILIIGFCLSIYYGSNKVVAGNNIENQKLYDIVNTFFNEMDSASLSYITSRDMYYWDIAKTIYGDATYWPLIYSYNNDKYKISNIIKKGSTIMYRNIPDFSSVNDIQNLGNTLSKSYISIYPILMNDKKTNHALWALRLSAYYDLNVFKNNAEMIPQKTYSNIVQENASIGSAYNDFIKNGRLNENMFMSLIDTIKEKLGIKR